MAAFTWAAKARVIPPSARRPSATYGSPCMTIRAAKVRPRLMMASGSGRSFTRPVLLQTFTRYPPLDISDPQPIPIPAQYRDDPYETAESAADALAAGATRECGDFASHCLSGYTFPRVGAIGSQV